MPYYYISHPDYLRGCKIWSLEGTNQTPVIFGATPVPNDFWGGSGDAGDAGAADEQLADRAVSDRPQLLVQQDRGGAGQGGAELPAVQHLPETQGFAPFVL